MTDDFGFRVERGPDDTWSVYLPHQCDDWQVSGFRVPHDEAVRALEQFVAEAKAALATLKRRDEMVEFPAGPMHERFTRLYEDALVRLLDGNAIRRLQSAWQAAVAQEKTKKLADRDLSNEHLSAVALSILEEGTN